MAYKRKYKRYATKERLDKVNPKNLKAIDRYYQNRVMINPETKDTTYKVYVSALNIFMCFVMENYDNIYVLNEDFIESEFIDCIEDYMFFLSSEEGLGNKKKAINLKLSALSSFYQYYTRKQKVKYNPMTTGAIERMQNAKDEKLISSNFLNEDEVNKIFEELDKVVLPNYNGRYDRLDRVFWYVAYTSANRIGALSKLSLSDLDREDMAFKNIREKRAKYVNIPVTNEVLEVIDEYIEYRQKQGIYTDALFPRWNSKIRSWVNMSSGGLTLRVKKIGEIVGLDDFSPHDIRKSRGNYINEKYGIKLAQQLLNHESSSTTEAHYIVQKDATDAMKKILELESKEQRGE